MVTYIAATCLVLVAAVYVYSYRVQAFASMGLDYLHTLDGDSQKLANDVPTIMILQTRDLPNFTKFLGEFGRIRATFITAIIVNICVIVLYPYDTLMYNWMGWVINGACVLANLDAGIMVHILRRNKNTISKICNAYYFIVLRNEEEAKVEEVVKEIDDAFDEIVKNIDTIRAADEEKKNANSDE